MTEYQIFPLSNGFTVESTDDEGKLHTTIFLGPLSRQRAEVYCEMMNERNKHPVVYPGE